MATACDPPRIVGFVFALAATSAPFAAEAQALRLRGDAVVDTQSQAETQSPAGLLVLQGQDKIRPWVDAEGLVWAGAGSGATADVLVLSLRLHDPHGRGEVRVGRFVVATGAVFPVQVDGVEAIGRTPWGSSLEVFGGAPVVPRFGSRAYDWLVGGRLSQHVISKVAVGVSYIERREYGDISNEEAGADVSATPTPWLDLAAKGAYDLTSPGIADARVSVSARSEAVRVELFASDQSPGRLLPATSLFSVLGDFPSQMVGSTVKWSAAPRLDVLAGGAAQSVGGQLGGNGWARATLRLDEGGLGSFGIEVRRVDVSTARWTGFRAVGVQPLGRGFRFSSEIEIVVPDEPTGRGIAWPWGLMALGWKSTTGWEVAAAIEAASTPTHEYETNALARLGRSLALP